MRGHKGQNGPNYLKCTMCKRERDMWDNARTGELVQTGRVRRLHSKRLGGRGPQRQLLCRRCGHVGWYTHRDASRCPMITAGDRITFEGRV
jgi:hypothetical protein